MCQHYWVIPPPTYDEHLIGVCRRCGATKDFTELQEQDMGYKQICLANTLTRPVVDMSRIMAVKKPKGRPSNYRLSSPSRGRVG